MSLGCRFWERDFINDTFLVETESPQKYILQKKNRSVFHDIPGMMANIDKVTRHIRSKEAVTSEFIMLYEDLYYKDSEGEYWTCCTYIPDTYTYEQASDKEMIRAGGEGIGMFHSQMADFQGTLVKLSHIARIPQHQVPPDNFRLGKGKPRRKTDGIASLVKEIYSRQENGVVLQADS